MVKEPAVYKVCDRQELDQKELVCPFDKRNRAEEEKEDKKVDIRIPVRLMERETVKEIYV